MKFQRRLVFITAAIIVRFVHFLSKRFGFGEGSNIPGKVVLKIFPNLLKILVPRFKNGWILITGTNGKTTTTKILVELMEKANLAVVTNARGANLVTGIVTSILLAKLKPAQSIMADYAVFEIDEAVLGRSFNLFQPQLLVVTNFSRDQLDRYGEIDSNVNKIIDLLEKADYPCKVVLNGNDPNIARIGSVTNTENRIYFGIKDSVNSSEQGLLVEKDIGKGLEAGFELPDLDLWAESIKTDYLKGSQFDLGYHQKKMRVNLKLPGVFNILNTLAAIASCITMGIQHDLETLNVYLEKITPSYGRSEQFQYKDTFIFMFLVKNPVGFNHIIQLLTQASSDKRILLLLNDLTADGTDVSWIWDVALENLWKVSGIKEVVTSGTRAGDMALRVKYSEPLKFPLTVDYSPRRAFQELILRMKTGEELLILANYTSMIQFRPYLLRKCR